MMVRATGALAIACAAACGSGDDDSIEPTCGELPAGACTAAQCDSNMPDSPDYPGCPGGSVYVCRPTGWAVDRPCVTYVVQVDGPWHLDAAAGGAPCANLVAPTSLDLSAAHPSDPLTLEVTGASGMFENESVNIRYAEADVSFDLYDAWSDGASGTRDVRVLFALTFDGRAGTLHGRGDGLTLGTTACGFRLDITGTFTPAFAPWTPPE